MAPPPARRVYREIRPHIAIASYLRRAWPEDLPWTHFPAGERRDDETRKKLWAMGLFAGWADFQFILPNGQFACIEIKADLGVLSDPQIEHRKKCLKLGVAYAICRTPEEVEIVITKWLAAFGRRPRATIVRRGA